MKNRSFIQSLSALSLTLALAFSAAADRGLPPQEGINNFGKVNERLYRGAQPDSSAIQNLQRLGIKSIINLRMAGDASKTEPAEARAHGITYTNIPVRGVGRPTDAQIAQVLASIEALPSPVFIHCEHGCDRTGTIVACYRIKHDHWTGEAALKEAERYGMSPLERGMKAFVVDFARPANRAAAP